MKKIAEIDQINQLLIENKEVIWTGNTVLVNSEVVSEGDVKLIKLHDNKLYVQKSDSSELIDIVSLETSKLPFVGDLIQSEILLYGVWNETYTQRKVFAIDFSTKKEIWNRDIGLGKILWQEEYLFGGYSSSLNRYNPKTGNELWILNLETLGEYTINGETKMIDFQQYIGIKNEIVYVKVGNSLIIGVNINTGEIEFKSKYEEDYLVLDYLRLDKDTNSIFSIGPTHYIEFDLLSGKYTLSDHMTQTVENGVETSRLGGWSNDSIYFWEGTSNNRFGKFSRISKQIEWTNTIDEVAGKFPALKDVKYGNGKLYVNDHNNRLHIYKISEYAS